MQNAGSESRGLTTTSYAVLGLLSLREWSTYELAQQFQRGLRHFWRSAERGVYEEPKRLVARGLAVADKQRVGLRPRTVYRITPAGEQELRTWLGGEGRPATVEWEDGLRVMFADHATKQELLAAIRRLRVRELRGSSEGAAQMEDYLTTGGPFPQRLHLIALLTRFVQLQSEARLAWAEWAEEQVEQWPSTKSAGRWDARAPLREALEMERARAVLEAELD